MTMITAQNRNILTQTHLPGSVMNYLLKGDKHMEWEFNLPVKLVFGNGKRKDIEKYIGEIAGKNGVLVCGKSFEKKRCCR